MTTRSTRRPSVVLKLSMIANGFCQRLFPKRCVDGMIGIGLSCGYLILPGCVDVEPAREASARYRAAVADAAFAEPTEVVDNLTAIVPWNTDLIRDDEGRVLMVTWTSYPGYDELAGQDTPAGVELWVTVGRELQTFCRETGLRGAALALRLEQRLGLPPNVGKDRIVELWVPESALFRPAPDAEITDTTAELAIPSVAAAEHIGWLMNLTAASYGQQGYPWTRLGYTYDWSPDAQSDVGQSEFVIRKGAIVGVRSVSSHDEYCH